MDFISIKELNEIKGEDGFRFTANQTRPSLCVTFFAKKFSKNLSTLLENVLKKLKHKHQITGANRYFVKIQKVPRYNGFWATLINLLPGIYCK